QPSTHSLPHPPQRINNTPAQPPPHAPTTLPSNTITRIQQVNRMLDVSLEIETEQLINDLLGTHTRQVEAL
ncbi:hypothetical protein, partial [Streptomyces sp. NRRL F-5122]|uniref:hypothetical protein n=1 Tax=Streptomyces sp. NRRL F-5122 TaxID=1609098 RepID=UPI000A7F03DF